MLFEFCIVIITLLKHIYGNVKQICFSYNYRFVKMFKNCIESENFKNVFKKLYKSYFKTLLVNVIMFIKQKLSMCLLNYADPGGAGGLKPP